MDTFEEQGQLEKQTAEQILAAATPFREIQSARVELFEDHSGDPSMRITFRLNPEFKPDDDWLREFNEYSNRISSELLHSGLSRFPYTRFEHAA